jgi:hypothetical protein
MEMLKEKTVSYENLLLDPNNPRLFENFEENIEIPDVLAEEKQEFLLTLFASRDRSEFTNIEDVMNSMRQIGFVGIHNVIVREIGDTGKYIVVEGNRRLASIKTLLQQHEEAMPGSPQRIDDEMKLESLKRIKVQVLQVEGKSEQEVKESIRTILGLGHIGGALEWGPLAKGNNIYKEYMKQLSGENPEFEWVTAAGTKIADILAIPRTKVKKSLVDYLCWLQIGEITSDVKAHHYSLISACVSNSNLKAHGYISIHEKTFQLEGDSAGKIIQMCEFDRRDNRPEDEENILRDPKAVGRLGLIFKDSRFHESQSVKDFAIGLFQEVLSRGRTLDEAQSALTAFKKQNKWVQSVEKLLEKQSSESRLAIDKFLNAGQGLQNKTDLEKLVKRFLLLMDL